ncbi:phosphomannomutase/phosphoglucomutase [Acanthopleuribacter pedis]|uniref:Phosphomannomutase/phosphoglucomutase n=1 Tax=Acanthopleuribacter pedis TaxID=442870 RepID=A0A8J7QCP8_9BACT|nr:phosphomannomutase/phosphoglucomutase [Acanthopleuribacter pedis]MBO1321349.1 phosphomannomutase/phosphoglucomutase [Acanthopleuribacter pedis]
MAGIFKAYDIRGVYGEVLDAQMGYKIGVAFSNLIGAGKTIVIGRDGRPHSEELQAAFIEGVRDGGSHVVNMGLCTTPTSYFACVRGAFDGAAVITASHNPGQYNGIKLSRAKAVPVGYAEGINTMEAAINEDRLVKAGQRGDLTEQDFKPAYLDFLKEACAFTHKFKFAVDCGNGMGGFLIEDFLKKTEQEAVALFWDMDFTFPNHLANPLDFTTLEALQAKVRQKGLDFGVAFDGDADRCFFVDNQGEVVPADILTALIAVDFLKKRGPGAIIYDIRSSKVVAEQIIANGGTPVLCRVGHSFMKAKLREMDGPFGGELAGHFYFKDFFFADSAFYTMITVMNIIEESGKTLAELIAPFKIYVPSGEINFKTEIADDLLAEADTVFPNGQVNTIDGVRIDFPDWWFSLRKSNTEPLLRLVVEADKQDLLDEKVAAVRKWLGDRGAVEMAGGH